MRPQMSGAAPDLTSRRPASAALPSAIRAIMSGIGFPRGQAATHSPQRRHLDASCMASRRESPSTVSAKVVLLASTGIAFSGTLGGRSTFTAMAPSPADEAALAAAFLSKAGK